MQDCEGGEQIKVSFCPRCRSYEVRYVFGLGNLFGVVPKMRCGGRVRTLRFQNASLPECFAPRTLRCQTEFIDSVIFMGGGF